MGAEHQILSMVESGLGSEMRRRRGQAGDPQAWVICREPHLRVTRESATRVLHRRLEPYPTRWERPRRRLNLQL